MRGINTLINTSFFFSTTCYYTQKNPLSQSSTQQFSMSPQLVALSLHNARHLPAPQASESERLLARGGSAQGWPPHQNIHGNMRKELFSHGPPPRAPGVKCSLSQNIKLHCVSLLPLKLHKTQEQPESRQKRFWNQHRFTESKLFKVKVYLYSL